MPVKNPMTSSERKGVIIIAAIAIIIITMGIAFSLWNSGRETTNDIEIATVEEVPNPIEANDDNTLGNKPKRKSKAKAKSSSKKTNKTVGRRRSPRDETI